MFLNMYYFLSECVNAVGDKLVADAVAGLEAKKVTRNSRKLLSLSERGSVSRQVVGEKRSELGLRNHCVSKQWRIKNAFVFTWNVLAVGLVTSSMKNARTSTQILITSAVLSNFVLLVVVRSAA